jgi:uncharacterized glyoxalase superfamily protein PhnB/GNAT superfamily N-acetyltransferase
VPAVVALVQSAYRGEASRAGWTTEADLLDGQRTDSEEVGGLISKPGSEILLAEAPGELVASCHLERRSAATAYFGMFAVRPGRQGGGIGRVVLHEAARLAATWGCTELRMTVIRQRTDLIAWYVRRGYRPTGETLPFPYGDERFGRPRRDDLEFAVLAGPIAQNEGVTEQLAPAGYHSVTPRLVVADVAGAVEFLRAVFDATGDVAPERPAEIRIGDSLVLVSGAGERELFPAFLYVYVDDADRRYERALRAGALSLEEPLDTPYGDRRAMVSDPFGNVFQIAHRRGDR